MKNTKKNIEILVVARWPLGGIRTYMRYIFRHFPSNYKLTLVASSTQEDTAIAKDAEEYSARLLLVHGSDTRKFVSQVFNELRKNKYDVILSQGFISAVAVYAANFFFRVPHVLTIHGILEPKYFEGKFSGLKKLLLNKVLYGVTVLYGVSNDILDHLYEQFPNLKENGPRAIVIPNGIEPAEFESPPSQVNLRDKLGLDPSIFLFGFFGRFMHQKGFDLLIQAVDRLRHQSDVRPFAVVAVGSGDYIRELQHDIREQGLESYFHFLPFQPQVHQLYPQVNAIVMPSRWEACPLLPMEALCMGTPLIASDCIGLRETVSETPTMVFPAENMCKLLELMSQCLINDNREEFKQFIPQAKDRYDVVNSTQQLAQLIQELIGRRQNKAGDVVKGSC